MDNTKLTRQMMQNTRCIMQNKRKKVNNTTQKWKAPKQDLSTYFWLNLWFSHMYIHTCIFTHVHCTCIQIQTFNLTCDHWIAYTFEVFKIRMKKYMHRYFHHLIFTRYNSVIYSSVFGIEIAQSLRKTNNVCQPRVVLLSAIYFQHQQIGKEEKSAI